MAATRTNGTTPIAPVTSIPDTASYTATEHWSGGLHWTYYRPKQRREGAKTLVFIHGAGHNEYVWTLGEHNWIAFFIHLGYEVMILSLTGHKPSRGNATFQTLSRYVRDAHTPVEALGLADEQVVFVGHSMGGIIVEAMLARYPRIAGAVVVECVAFHKTFDTYLPFLRSFFPRHPRTALAAMVSPAAMFRTDALVRELLVGEDASDALVASLRPHLGGETTLVTASMLAAKRRGRPALDGRKLLFLAARHSAFYPSSLAEESARELGATCVVVDGPHNLMMAKSSALPAAQAIAAFLATLPVSAPVA